MLGLGPDGHNPDELRRAYRRAVHRHHPDRPDGDAVQFRESVLAFELLTVTPDQAITPVVPPSETVPSTAGPAPEPSARLDLLMLGLDRIGSVR